jgi:hypothetical protein
MTKFLLRIAGVVLFSSFAATSGAFASTDGSTKLVENLDDQTIEPIGPTESIDAAKSPKPPIDIVDESSPAWTRADCIKAWKMNMMGCNASPPNLRPACWAAASALLAACVAASQG